MTATDSLTTPAPPGPGPLAGPRSTCPYCGGELVELDPITETDTFDRRLYGCLSCAAQLVRTVTVRAAHTAERLDTETATVLGNVARAARIVARLGSEDELEASKAVSVELHLPARDAVRLVREVRRRLTPTQESNR